MKKRTFNWVAAIIILALVWMAVMLAVWTLGFLVKIFLYALILAVVTFLVIKIYRRFKQSNN
jgi:predicted PurR-regulated permease PerM